MNVLDIAGIVFACTAANHLGLIGSIQLVLKWNKLPIVSCVKCFSFWAVLAYCVGCCDDIATAIEEAPRMLAISFLSAWAAIWLDLGMGFIDYLYMKAYGKIYTTADGTDANEAGADDAVPGVRGG